LILGISICFLLKLSLWFCLLSFLKYVYNIFRSYVASKVFFFKFQFVCFIFSPICFLLYFLQQIWICIKLIWWLVTYAKLLPANTWRRKHFPKHCVVLCVVKMRKVLINISNRILVSVFFILNIFIPFSYLLHSCIIFSFRGGPNCILGIPSNQFSFEYFDHI
jgi:hypothetical protein